MAIALPELDAGPFSTWFNDTVIKTNNQGERPGSIEWLDPTLKTVLASVQFSNLGIVRYELDPMARGTEQQGCGGMVEIEMYCETVALAIQGG